MLTYLNFVLNVVGKRTWATKYIRLYHFKICNGRLRIIYFNGKSQYYFTRGEGQFVEILIQIPLSSSQIPLLIN
jgi:hypothetical protein